MKKMLVACVAMFITLQLVSNDLSWTFPPTTLSSVTQNSSDAQIAMDGNGNVISAWVENGVIKARAKLVNAAWGATSTISSTTASSPRIVSDLNGNATAIWLENGIIKAASRPFNGSWTSATSLSTAGASAPDLTVDSAGNVVAVWAKNGNVESSTKLFGNNWQARVSISSTAAAAPRVAIGGTGSSTRAVVVWYGTSGATNIIYTSSKLLSGSWSSQLAISDTTRNAIFPHVAMDANANAIAVWYSYDITGVNYYNVIVQSSSRLSSGSWTSLVRLSEPGLRNPATLAARVAFDGSGNAIALWNTSFDDETFNIQSAVKPVMKNWTATTDLVSFNLYSYNSSLAMTALGDALSMFMFSNGSSILIQSSESDITGFMNNVWSVPTIVSLNAQNNAPRVAATLTGNVINAAAVWITSSGGNNIVSATIGTRSIVLPPSGLTVIQNLNSFGVFNEYSNTLSWSASADPNLTGYLIYRNGVYLEEVSSNTLSFTDHNRVQNGPVTYGVSAINNQNTHSRIVTVNFP